MEASGNQDGPPARGDAWLLAQPRAVPHLRTVRTGLRTIHLATMAVLYGGHVLGVEASRLIPALAGTVGSGVALASLDAWRAPIWLVQVRGVATYLKLVLVAAVAWWWEGRLLLLTLALIIGSVVSHMPGRWRYHSLLHGRPLGPRDLG